MAGNYSLTKSHIFCIYYYRVPPNLNFGCKFLVLLCCLLASCNLYHLIEMGFGSVAILLVRVIRSFFSEKKREEEEGKVKKKIVIGVTF